MTFTCAAAGFFVFACTAPEVQVPAARLLGLAIGGAALALMTIHLIGG